MATGKVNTGTTSVGTFWSDLPAIAKIITWIVALSTAFVSIRYGLKWWKQHKAEHALNNSTMTGTTGTGNAITVDLGSVAGQINEAFYDNDWMGLTEDEEGAITAIVSVPKSLIPDLIPVYKAVSDGHDLKSDFLQYLSTEQYDRVKYLFT